MCVCVRACVCVQDRNDDVLAGVKSTAVRLGDSTKIWLSGFSAVMAAGLTTTGFMCHQTWPYYAGVSLMSASLAHQVSLTCYIIGDNAFQVPKLWGTELQVAKLPHAGSFWDFICTPEQSTDRC